jgi:ribosomal protein S18 acetylase RimI-like enzyme
VVIRDATAAEFAAVGDLRVAAYVMGGFLAPDSGYVPRLRTLGRNAEGTVLVAVSADGQIVGTIMLQPMPYAGPIVTGPDEAEIRALAVTPGAQGHGIGGALLQAALERAVRQGTRNLVLATQQDMHAAHRLYEQAGFHRLPDRDWSPEPGTDLLVYGFRLDQQAPLPG